jgi:CRISPR-associated protein Cmr3
MSVYLTLVPRDPIIARDSRPFGAGQGLRMKSLDWPYPSVLAGSLRSLLGKTESQGSPFSEELIGRLKRMEVAGPLPLVNDELYFPAPKDLMVCKKEDGGRAMKALRPMHLQNGMGCNLPDGLIPVEINENAKPEKSPSFWSSSTMVRWLKEECVDVPPERAETGSGFLDIPGKDERMHVCINPNSGTSEEGLLFMTVGLDMSSGINLAVRVEAADGWEQKLMALDEFHPFGGERRLVHWKQMSSQAWECPVEIREALRDAKPGGKGMRLVLATPALFKHGWRPNWLHSVNGKLEGRPRQDSAVTLRLVSACIERWKPISGWSLEKGKVGPKALKRLVPAGSTFFFEVVEGDAGDLAGKLWLHSVSDEEQDRRDGFGLALWGVWASNEGRQ